MSEKTEKKPTEYVAFELDGVLAEHSSGETIGAPIERMIDIAKQYIAAGVEVRVVTHRVNAADFNIEMPDCLKTLGAVQEWCERHIGKTLAVQSRATGADMLALFSSNCIQVEPNTGVILVDYYRAAADAMNAQLEEIRAALGVAQQKHIMAEIRRLVK